MHVQMIISSQSGRWVKGSYGTSSGPVDSEQVMTEFKRDSAGEQQKQAETAVTSSSGSRTPSERNRLFMDTIRNELSSSFSNSDVLYFNG